jgi:hypothetical protein
VHSALRGASLRLRADTALVRASYDVLRVHVKAYGSYRTTCGGVECKLGGLRIMKRTGPEMLIRSLFIHCSSQRTVVLKSCKDGE